MTSLAMKRRKPYQSDRDDVLDVYLWRDGLRRVLGEVQPLVAEDDVLELLVLGARADDARVAVTYPLECVSVQRATEERLQLVVRTSRHCFAVKMQLLNSQYILFAYPTRKSLTN